MTLTIGVVGMQAPCWLAMKALQQRDAEAALRWLNWAERLGTDKGTIAIARNRAFRQLGQFAEVREQLLLANTLGVSRQRIEREEWLAFALSGQMEIAEPHLSDLLVSQDIPVGETCAAYAAGFLLTARPGEALQLIEAWLKDEPEARQAYYLRGQPHASVKQFAAAEEAFQQALKLAPERADVSLAMAESLLELQRPEDAQPYFQRAAEASGFADADRARLGWARAARRQGDSATAEQLLTDITNRSPQRAEVWEELGRAQFDRGATDDAVRSLEKSVAIQPATVSARQALAIMLAAAGRGESAQPHLDYTARAVADLERLRLLEDSASTGIGALGANYVGFGTAFGDWDLDGDEDLVVSNGHVQMVPSNAPVRQRPLLLTNQDGRRLVNATAGAGAYFAESHIGRGIASGDLDRDGDLDLVSTPTNESAAVLVNTSPRKGRWVQVAMVARQSPRDAIGAQAILETSIGSRVRQVTSGGSYLSQSARTLHWGLPTGATADWLAVRWPSGAEQRFAVPSLETEWLAIEGRSELLAIRP